MAISHVFFAVATHFTRAAVAPVLRSGRSLQARGNCQKPSGNIVANMIVLIGSDLGSGGRQHVDNIIRVANDVLRPDLGYTIKVKEYKNVQTDGCRHSIYAKLSQLKRSSTRGYFNHLLTSCYGGAGIVGLADASGGVPLCNYNNCVGISHIPHPRQGTVTKQGVSTFVHELAHNFGAHHATERGYRGYMNASGPNPEYTIDSKNRCLVFNKIELTLARRGTAISRNENSGGNQSTPTRNPVRLPPRVPTSGNPTSGKFFLSKGTDCGREGARAVTDVNTCQLAVQALGYGNNRVKRGNWERTPKGCFSKGNQVVYFNHYDRAQNPFSTYHQICHGKSGGPTVVGGPTRGPTSGGNTYLDRLRNAYAEAKLRFENAERSARAAALNKDRMYSLMKEAGLRLKAGLRR